MNTLGTRHVVLVGLMGTGKTTVGTLLAARLGRPLVDTDHAVEGATGRTVRDIWKAEGEAAYRVLENGVVADALASPIPAVIAAAGGVVLAEVNRKLIRESGAVVVWLQADPEVLVDRTATGGHRPLLDGDPLGVLTRMATDRADWYAEVATHTVAVGGRTPTEVLDDVVRVVGADAGHSVVVPVDLGDRSYEVVVGHGAISELARLLPSTATRAAVVTQAGIPLGADDALEPLRGAGLTVTRLEIGDGEASKTLATIETLTRAFATAGITRSDVVIGIGGGMVTDVAGFAAAAWHRGVPVVHVSTTLLGMVDAAIGGKTGVNLPEGKNLVGAFWQPSGVICDLDALATLAPRERRSGDGEMAKYHFLTGDDLAAMPLTDRVARCVAIKAEVVASDEREGGRRALLNYGHTLAHALEIATDHALTHGESVAIGLIFAAELAAELGRIDSDRVAEHRRVVGEVYGLPTTLPTGLAVDELVALMGRDKKVLDRSGLTFVLDGPDGVEVVTGIDPATVAGVLGRYGSGA